MTWSSSGQSHELPNGTLSCASRTFCVSMNNRGGYSVYDGSDWSFALDLGGGGMKAISCPATDFCVAVSEYNHAFVYSGSVWTRSHSLDPEGGGDFSSVSCPSAALCTAVDTWGDAVSYTKAA